MEDFRPCHLTFSPAASHPTSLFATRNEYLELREIRASNVGETDPFFGSDDEAGLVKRGCDWTGIGSFHFPAYAAIISLCLESSITDKVPRDMLGRSNPADARYVSKSLDTSFECDYYWIAHHANRLVYQDVSLKPWQRNRIGS